jgi:imidazolonepropionase-like amidohydrolase
MPTAPLLARTVRRLVTVLLALTSSFIQCPDGPERVILENVIVIDGTGAAPVPGRTIVIDGDRIVAVGPSAAMTTWRGRRVDLSGRWVMPGLIDMHAHMAFGPVEFAVANGVPSARLTPDADVGRAFARELLRWGVTTVRNPGGPTAEAVAIRDAIARGEIPGPRIVTAGAVIDRTPFEGLAALVRTPADVVAEVARQAEAGVDFVKLYAALPPEFVKAGVEAAHARGLAAVGHLWLTDWKTAADLGLDGIVHALPLAEAQLPPAAREPFRRGISGSQVMYQWFEHADVDGPEIGEAARAMAERGVAWDPTLVTVESIFFGDEPRLTSSPSLDCVPASLRASWRAFVRAAGWSPDDFRRAKAQFDKALALTGRLHRAGVRIVAGTDLAMPWIVPGESLHREMELLVRAGLTPLEAIAAATGRAAEGLGRDRGVGTIAAGRRADLVILDANPAADIRATRAIRAVWQGGTVVHTGASR